MPVYREMDPELILKIIEGYTNELEPEAEELEKLYKQKCNRCGADFRKEFDGRHAFSDGSYMVPRALLRCPFCGRLKDPYTGLIIEDGDPSKIPTESIKLLGQG